MKQLLGTLIIITLFLTIPCAAASDINLDQIHIELAPGESLTLKAEVNTPGNIPNLPLWTVIDPGVAEVSADGTVTALTPGETVIFAESFDKQANTSCIVNVSGPVKKETTQPNQGLIKTAALSDDDVRKIKDPSLVGMVALIKSLPETHLTASETSEVLFKVLVETVPGKTEKVSQAAYDLGALDATPINNADLVTLQATLEQITDLISNNSDIVEIRSDKLLSMEFEELSPAGLEGHLEELTALSHLHDGLGLKGKGSVIAVMDTGFNTSHPEIAGRVKHQKCFASSEPNANGRIQSPCVNEDNAFPINTQFPSVFSHGTHVAGIAAGLHGIAPEAELILIGFASEMIFPVSDSKDCTGEYQYGLCHNSILCNSDMLKGYEYLLNLIAEGEQIDVLNMSYGNTVYSKDLCEDRTSYEYRMLKKLQTAGVVTVAAASNSGNDYRFGNPACYPAVFTVAALEDQDVPTVTSYSNYGKGIDIAAPGHQLYSANYLYGIEPDAPEFVEKDGTSMAAPVVSGYIALMGQLYPEKRGAELESILLDSPLTVTNISRGTKTDYDTYSIEDYYGADYAEYIKPVVNFSDYEPVVDEPILRNIAADLLEINLVSSLFADDALVYLSVLQDDDVIFEETLINPESMLLTAVLPGAAEEPIPDRLFTVSDLQPDTAYLVRVRSVSDVQRIWTTEFVTPSLKENKSLHDSGQQDALSGQALLFERLEQSPLPSTGFAGN